MTPRPDATLAGPIRRPRTVLPETLIRPFAGLRPAPGRAAEVAAPPYDVLSTEEARALAADNPWSFLHVSLPEIDLPPGTDPHAPEVYRKAGENMDRMIDSGLLRRDPVPCYYAYRLTMDDCVQTGIAAAGAIAAYQSNRIRRHEFTRPDKVDDRARQIEAVNAQTGPVLVAHRPDPEVAGVLARATAPPPDIDLVARNGVGHTLWTISDAAEIDRLTAAFDAMDALYIADGHHRSAAAAQVAADRHAANPRHRGDEPYNAFLLVSFPADELRILDYNRVVRDLNGLTPKAALAAVRTRFRVEASRKPVQPARPGGFGMYLDGRWYRLFPLDPPTPVDGVVKTLDVSVLAARLLGPVLNIGDPRLDSRIDFVGGIRGVEALQRRVDSGEMAVAFTLCPPGMADLLAVADTGEVMPPKSTWFEPKLADGLVCYPLD